MNQDLIKSLFEVKEGLLTWKVDRGPNKVCGKPAGTIHKRFGYLRTLINRKSYANHRLIFLYYNGYIPEYIDHIDGNKLNNKIENLRAATKSQNNSNSRISKLNTSGIKGVDFHAGTNKWRARISLNKKSIHVGYFDNLEDARVKINEERIKYHKEFANFGV